MICAATVLLSLSCGKTRPRNQDTGEKATESKYVALAPDSTTVHELDMNKEGEGFAVHTTGTDPYLSLQALPQAIGERQVLTFQYKASAALAALQVFLGAPVTEQRSLRSPALTQTDSWTSFSLDLGDEIAAFSWGKAGDFLRLDFGNAPGLDLVVRHLRLRERTEAEQAAAAERAAFRQTDQLRSEQLTHYLHTTYGAAVTRVAVTADELHIQGVVRDQEQAALFEVTPYEAVTDLQGTERIQALHSGPFSITLKRFVEKDGYRYDRLLSKWVIASGAETVHGLEKLYAHARFPDVIPAKYAMAAPHLKNRKGLGGLRNDPLMIQDLDALHIGSVTINLPITSYVYLDQRPGTVAHPYGGKTYYFDVKKLQALDHLLKEAAQRDILVSAIVLVLKASDCPDPKVGALMQNVHCAPTAFFSMPRLDNAASVNCYAAVLDFLAARYCRPDGKYGRIHKWIMHNEVDAGTTWTNMGADRPLQVYLNAYYRSMRICYAMARKYDPHAEVLGSFTHSWRAPTPEGDYAVLDLLEGLKNYAAAEGDFQWGLACHPYPEDLKEPRTWADKDATFSMQSPLVTFKNLEVIDAWIKRPENKYKGTEKRTLWLSENGTNSPTYGKQDLLAQAAGFAYAWKKMAQLDGIDALQWHNWMDNRGEFGLKIGLRRYPDDATDPAGKKPVWLAYEAAGTGAEDRVFAPYKKVIGITDWQEIMHAVH